MKIGLLSDNHSYIDEAICNQLETCDEIWHAGDIGKAEIINQLKTIAPVIGVYGNIDSGVIRNEFPQNQLLNREGLTFLMTHIAGSPGRYSNRVQQLITSHTPQVLICGHSHILKVQKYPRHGVLHINPGACGKHGFHKMRTMVRFEVKSEKITNFEVIELGKRGAIH